MRHSAPWRRDLAARASFVSPDEHWTLIFAYSYDFSHYLFESAFIGVQLLFGSLWRWEALGRRFFTFPHDLRESAFIGVRSSVCLLKNVRYTRFP